jgi:hypothetical protein
MALQALLYADGADTSEFVHSALQTVHSDEVRPLIEAIQARMTA